MSTVPEVIAARHMGVRVLAISCITNMAAGVSKKKLDHLEVLEVGGEGAERPARRAGPDHRGRGPAVVKQRDRADPREACASSARLARPARRRAHAPFSRFKVGAALRTADGEIVTGCNIENASYGLTMCAERVAVFKAVSEGRSDFDAIAVVVDSPRLTAPCGACRQILWEFCGRHLGAHGGPARAMREPCACPSCCRSRSTEEPLAMQGGTVLDAPPYALGLPPMTLAPE